MKRPRLPREKEAEFPALVNKLAEVPVDVIEKHIVPYLKVGEYQYLCRVDQRMALSCRKMGDRVWAMFVRRDFPTLSTPSVVCKDEKFPNKCTYYLYQRHAYKLPDGNHVFFSSNERLIHSTWLPFPQDVIWAFNPTTRTFSSFGVSNPSAMQGAIQYFIKEGFLGLVGYLRPTDGAVVLFKSDNDAESRKILQVAKTEFSRLLSLKRMQKDLEELLQERDELDERIRALAAEIKDSS